MNLFKLFLTYIYIYYFPLLFIYLTNIKQYSFNYYLPSIVLLFFFYILIFLISIIFFSKVKIVNHIFGSVIIFFSISFLVDDISRSIGFFYKLLLYLFLIVVIFSLVRIKLNITKKFLYIFFSIILLYYFFININFNSISFFKSEYKNKLPNIYFIIMDEMTSPKILQDDFDINISDFITRPSTSIVNAKSNYLLTLESITNLIFERKLLETDKNNLYPFRTNLENNTFFNFLYNFNYDLYSVGNIWVECIKTNHFLCINDYRGFYPFDYIVKKLPITKIIEEYFHKEIEYLKEVLVRYMFRNSIIKTMDAKKIPFNSSQENEIQFISKFIQHTDKINLTKKNNFFFVHNMGPHHPFRYQNCTRPIINLQHLNHKEYFNFYKESVICVLKTTNDFLTVIDKHDPNSIVFLFSDHGINQITDKGLLNEKDNQRTDDIMIIYRTNKECQTKQHDLNNINDITKTVIDCINNYHFNLVK